MTFRLREGVEPASFLQLDAQIQTEVAYQQPGLLRRTAGRSDTDRWLILQTWATGDAADLGRAALNSSPLWLELDAMVEPESVRLERFVGLD